MSRECDIAQRDVWEPPIRDRHIGRGSGSACKRHVAAIAGRHDAGGRRRLHGARRASVAAGTRHKQRNPA